MDQNIIIESICDLNERLKRLVLMSSDLEDQMDELEDVSAYKIQFQNDFAAINNNRNDFKIIENFRNDLELEAYVKDLEKTLELVRNNNFNIQPRILIKIHHQHRSCKNIVTILRRPSKRPS